MNCYKQKRYKNYYENGSKLNLERNKRRERNEEKQKEIERRKEEGARIIKRLELLLGERIAEHSKRNCRKEQKSE